VDHVLAIGGQELVMPPVGLDCFPPLGFGSSQNITEVTICFDSRCHWISLFFGDGISGPSQVLTTAPSRNLRGDS